MMLLERSSDAAFAVQLQIDTFKRRPPRSRHHVNPGPEPLLELILPSQSTLGEMTFIVFTVIRTCPPLPPYRGTQQQGVRVPQRGERAGALDAPLWQPVEQQQQETPRAHSPHTYQHGLPQTGLVAPHLLHRHTR